MRLSLALSSATALLLLAASADAGLTRQKSCRDCTCTVTLSNLRPQSSPDSEDIKHAMNTACNIFTGGDGYYWTKKPTMVNKDPKNWKGDAHFWRLCNNGKTARGSWDRELWPLVNVNIAISCDACGGSARCHDHSTCQYSGLTH